MATNKKTKPEQKKSGYPVQAANYKAGIDQNTSQKSWPVLGTSYTTAALDARLQGIIDVDAAVQAARADFKAAVAKKKSTGAADRSFLSGLRSVIIQIEGTDPAALAPYGIVVPPKRGKPTVAAQAIALAKRRQVNAKKQAMQQALTGPQESVVVYDAAGQPINEAPPAAPAAAAPAVAK
jgi:hypothetical protein